MGSTTRRRRPPPSDTPARSELAEAVARLLLAAVRLRARREAESGQRLLRHGEAATGTGARTASLAEKEASDARR